MNLCWLFHKWSKWREVDKYEYSYSQYSPVVRVVIKRQCERCGDIQFRSVEYSK